MPGNAAISGLQEGGLPPGTAGLSGWRFWMDRGGTFTDCLGRSPDGRLHLAKVLSSPLAPIQCIRRILELPEPAPIPPCEVRMGTTLATNALLERRGHPLVLVATAGLAQALEIGTQQRPDLFALDIRKSAVPYQGVVEAKERLAPDGSVIEPLDREDLERKLSIVRTQGVDTLAVVLLHGYAHPAHERAAAEIAGRLGFTRVSCSHEVNPEIGLTARGDTTTVDAYLTPLIAAYAAALRGHLPGSTLQFMQSGGGLTDAARFRGHNAILSGPAAGVVACARLAAKNGLPKVIGFDMGGTSTDVSRHGGGAGAADFEKVYEWKVAGLRVRSPTLDIHTVAAGGGSLCRLKAGRLTVGPESAGSDPGPLCYGLADAAGRPKASELAVTDINLFLGRLLQDNFPFPLAAAPVAKALEHIRRELFAEGREMTLDAVALGFLEVVNRQMAQAVKDISVARGQEVSEHALLCFGGAGGQHACAVARLLGMRTVLLHPLAGVLSALGMGWAETRWEGSAAVASLPYSEAALASLEPAFAVLEERGRGELREQGFSGGRGDRGGRNGRIEFRRRLDLRYAGTEQPLSIPRPPDGDWLAAFRESHRKLYGYLRPGRAVEILQARLEAVGLSDEITFTALSPSATWPGGSAAGAPAGAALPFKTARMVLRSGAVEAPVYRRESLGDGAVIPGPALILDQAGTVVVEEDFRARADGEGQLFLERHDGGPARAWAETGTDDRAARTADDPVLLELFNHAFMSIAERMGTVLQRTALSTNIKERLDFSCAVFDAGGALVANAPHIPVHLGAMGESVRHILKAWPRPKPGDTFATNNPYRGGSHLPDITVVTPVFVDGSETPRFFVANRAHHADVGGSTPGSMPAFSRTLDEEGILLDAVRIAREGFFDAELAGRMFSAGPFPARNPADNLADLEAQAAANRAGASLLGELAAEHGLDRVLAQMGSLRANAARQVREALDRLPPGEHAFADALDDGTAIRVRVVIAPDSALVDFTGTGPESAGNLNAPPAVVRSAVLYALRCLVAERIPLNEGCLDPVRIVLPEGSILNPSPGRAVVGGNVETSQRVVDVLLGALGLAAASQGTMNNVTFGDGTFGYYETLAGGAGAGPGFHGASAVHTHMTNTRITDPEVLETRYPVRLERFEVRRGSGGLGRWTGGDGLIRQYRFLRPVEVSLLTQRRVRTPFGMEGGEAGAMGRNLRVTAEGGRTELPGATSYAAGTGEALIIETPGGGGWGPVSQDSLPGDAVNPFSE